MLTLTSERLILTRLQPEDWSLFLRVHQDAVSMQFISEVPDLEDIRQRFQERLAPWLVTSFHMLCLAIRSKTDGQGLGFIGINAEWIPYRQAEIGYALLSECFGQGYASEALGVLSTYLFQECEFHKLKALVVEGNQASRRVLEKKGFELEGTLRDNYQLRGEWTNSWIFGRINPFE